MADLEENVTPMSSRMLRATTMDYLVRAFFEIVGKTDTNYKHYEVRLNNLIFNNVEEITKKLIDGVFMPKIIEITDWKLSNQTYLSCLTHYDTSLEKCPVFVQYFDVQRGIQQDYLDYTDDDQSVLSILVNRQVLSKLSGFCGDFKADTFKIPEESDRFKSINILLQGKIRNLPIEDGIIDRMFTLLASYMHRDPVNFLMHLGEFLMGSHQSDRLLKEAQKHYASLLIQDRYILHSDYATFVALNFVQICISLRSHTFISKYVSDFANDLGSQFYLDFTLQLYLIIQAIETKGNGAVFYYFKLLKIIGELVVMKEQLFVPPICLKFKRFPHQEVSAFYGRACLLLDTISQKFDGFNSCCWILLENESVIFAQVEESYRNFIQQPCDGLNDEVAIVNEIIKSSQISNHPIDEKWVIILQICRDQNKEVPLITALLEYLFSLPSSFERASSLITENKNKPCECDLKKVIQLNLGITGLSLEQHGIEAFVSDMSQAETIVADSLIPMLEE